MSTSGIYLAVVSCDTNKTPHIIFKVPDQINLAAHAVGDLSPRNLIPVGYIFEDDKTFETELFTAFEGPKVNYNFAYVAMGEELQKFAKGDIFGKYLCHTNPNSTFVAAMGEVASMIDQISRDL